MDTPNTFGTPLGSIIGNIRINKPQEYTRQYEVAAWWTKLISHIGIFNLKLGADAYNSKCLFAYADVSGVVADEYMPALLGGVPVGDTNPQNIGKADTFTIKLLLHEAILNTGNSQNDEGVDWAVLPEFWNIAFQDAEVRMANAVSYLQSSWPKYRLLTDDQYNSNLSAVSYAGSEVGIWGNVLKRLHDHSKFRLSTTGRYDVNFAFATQRRWHLEQKDLRHHQRGR